MYRRSERQRGFGTETFTRRCAWSMNETLGMGITSPAGVRTLGAHRVGF